MLKNYITTAVRNFIKFKGYALINLFGLSIGIASAWIIFLYIKFEFSYDRFHPQADHIYHLETKIKLGKGDRFLTLTSTPLGLNDVIKTRLPEIERSLATVTEFGKKVYPSSDPSLIKNERNLYFVEPHFFEVFNFPILDGTSKTLEDIYTIMITETMAQDYFGGKNPIGESLMIQVQDTTLNFTVSAILKDPPDNTFLQFRAISSLNSYQSVIKGNPWEDHIGRTYISLHPSINKDSLDQKLVALAKEESSANSLFHRNEVNFELVSMVHKHLGTGAFKGNSLKSTLYTFAVVAILILLLACINYMNLSTARATTREKEIGMRKVLGAGRYQLSWQFFCEALCYSMFAAILGLIIADLSLPIFFRLLEKEFAESLWRCPETWFSILILGLITGILSGSYPAVYLSSLGKISHKLSQNKERQLLRKVLVTAQFTITTGMIAGVLIVSAQIGFMRNINLGFDTERVMYVDINSLISENRDIILEKELEKLPFIEAASLCSGKMDGATGGRTFEPTEGEEEMIRILNVDADFNRIMGFTLEEGRWYEKETTVANSGFLVNETFTKQFNKGVGDPLEDKVPHKKIIGVVKDFYLGSLEYAIRPVVFQHVDSSYRSTLAVKLSQGDLSSQMESIQEVWKSLNPSEPFEYSFLDERIEKLYTEEVRFANLMGIFTGLAILISCLGLLSLVAFSAERRTKEIGIRKIMGASIKDIIILLNQSFFFLILIAVVIAIPLSWWISQRWLENFAYRISIQPQYFVWAIFMVMTVAGITVSYFSFRAARGNPAEALRYE